jgi:site-specific DNA-cytosine methylase
MDELEPTIWVWESVTQAYLGENDELSQHITGHAMELGYSVYHFLHDVKFMGLPQQRRRVFTIASKVAIPFERFVPDFPRMTVGQTLAEVGDPGEVPSLSYKWQSYVPFVEQGGRLRTVVMKAVGRPAPGFLIHRANENEPSRTLLGGVHVLHPIENRFIGHKEAAALCGYPPDYEFDKAGGNYFQQIARAVTPAAGAYLGNVLQCSLEENRSVEPSEWEVNFMGKNGRVADFTINNKIRRLR